MDRSLIAEQDKEKPMAVRTANILAARGMHPWSVLPERNC